MNFIHGNQESLPGGDMYVSCVLDIQKISTYGSPSK